MNEDEVVDIIIGHLKSLHFIVAKEVGNFYRIADIAAISPSGEVWIIEGKLSSMKHAVKQLEVHKLSADRVFIGTPQRNLRRATIAMLESENIGVIFVDKSGKVDISVHDGDIDPFEPTRKELISTIKWISKENIIEDKHDYNAHPLQ